MEELGIGRPSTYAATLAVLSDREYVRLDKKRLVPEDKGRLVTAFLESFFNRWVDYDFTAELEEQLDKVSNHETDWRELLRDFWRDFSAAIGGHQGPAHDRGARQPQRDPGSAISSRRGQKAATPAPARCAATASCR